MIDDVLDFTGTSASQGKGSLSDIRHGIITAPILFAMEEFPQLRKVVGQLEKDPTNVDIVSLKEKSLLNSLIRFQSHLCYFT